jgi:hypothetical protein
MRHAIFTALSASLLAAPAFAQQAPSAATLDQRPETQIIPEWSDKRPVEPPPRLNEFIKSLLPCWAEPDLDNSGWKVAVCDRILSTPADVTSTPKRPKQPPLQPRHPDYGRGKLYRATPL